MGLGYNGRPFKLKLVDLSDDTQVNSGGGTDTQTLQPPTGKIYELVKLVLHIPDPVGSTANSHEIIGYYDMGHASVYREGIFRCVATTGNDIETAYNELNADSVEGPSNAREQYKIINGPLYASNTYAIKFKYDNDTDANQTGTRTILCLVKEYDEVI